MSEGSQPNSDVTNKEDSHRILTIESLSSGIPVIPDEAVGFYKQNCMVCFHVQGHKSGVSLTVAHGDSTTAFEVAWTGETTDQILRAYRDRQTASNHAACAIALILVRELTEYTAIEQSCIGTTIDYYLMRQQQDNDLIFNYSARLEVTGILEENEGNSVESRIRRKLRRLKPEGELPDLVVVVEFSRPWSKMVEV